MKKVSFELNSATSPQHEAALSHSRMTPNGLLIQSREYGGASRKPDGESVGHAGSTKCLSSIRSKEPSNGGVTRIVRSCALVCFLATPSRGVSSCSKHPTSAISRSNPKVLDKHHLSSGVCLRQSLGTPHLLDWASEPSRVDPRIRRTKWAQRATAFSATQRASHKSSLNYSSLRSGLHLRRITSREHKALTDRLWRRRDLSEGSRCNNPANRHKLFLLRFILPYAYPRLKPLAL